MSDDTAPPRTFHLGADAVVAKLEELLDLANRGELACCAIRVYRPDGTFEDIVLGGSVEQRVDALAAVRQRTDH